MVKPEDREIIVPSECSSELAPETRREIERLRHHCLVELKAVRQLHAWLDDKRTCRQACRVIGDSRTGKTFACDAYRLKHMTAGENPEAPFFPVIYWHATPETGQRELFIGLLEELKYRVTRGTLGEIRQRLKQILKLCRVEMIIVDEAHRLRPKTLAEICDLSDLCGVAIVLVGTDRLEAVLHRNDQVEKRFLSCHSFGRFDSRALEETTAIWEEYVLKMPEASNLTSPAMQKILGTSTRGYLGILDEILRNAARKALQAGRTKIDPSLLSEVAGEYR